jgi:hypothetical protein
MASTAVKLKQQDFVKYSPSEKKIFALIPPNGESISMDKLTRKYYRGRGVIPPAGQNTVSVMLRALMRKVEYNKEPFRINRSGRSGPRSTEVWIVSN